MVQGDLFEDGGANGKMNLKSVLSEYSRYWYVFILGILICVVLAYFRIRYSVPEYYVSSTILIKNQDAQRGLLSNVTAQTVDVFNADKNVDAEMNLLKSKSLMERVLRDLSFNVTYYREGPVTDLQVYGNDLPVKLIVSELDPTAFGKRISIHRKDDNSFLLEEEVGDTKLLSTYRFGQQIKKSYASFTVLEAGDMPATGVDDKTVIVFHDVQSLATRMSKKLYVAPVDKGSNVLTISITDPVWKNGVDVLNKLIELYEKEAVEDKNLMASNGLNFLDERLRYLNAELTDVEKNVELYKKQNDLTNVSSEAELYLKSADDYNKQLAEFDIQLELLKSVEDYLNRESGQDGLVPSSLNIQDPTLHILISKFNELHLERQRMQRTTQPDNPLMININEQLNNLRENIGENIKNIRNGLVITRQNLVASSAKFEYRKKRVPAIERELLEINRQQSVKEGLYLYLLQKREESALSLAATVSNFRIIDPPSVLYPILPNKPVIYMIAVFVGLMVPFFILYVRNLWNDKVRDLKDIEKATTTPILGEIARNKSKQAVVVTQDTINPLVEMFRLIRTNLQFITLGKPNKIILITSTMSGEGKSFFSINLAASLVLTGKKVVVLGMDLRKPTLLKALKMPEGLGITNFLVDENVRLENILRPSNVLPNLSIISSGPVLPSPTELMMSSRMADLMTALRNTFDYVIIDSAPIGLVADAFTLAPFIDATLYLVRRNYTPRDALSIVDKVYRDKRLRNPMIVLNDSSGKSHNYGYGYGYGDKPAKRRKTVPVDRKSKAHNEAVLNGKAIIE